MIDSSNGHQWTRRTPIVMTSAGRLWFHRCAPQPYEQRVSVDGGVTVSGWNFETYMTTMQKSRFDTDDLASCHLSMADLRQPLSIRSVLATDAVVLRGHRGMHTIVSLLKRRHIPYPLRWRWPLVTDERGVLWIPRLGFTNLPAEVKTDDLVQVVEWVGT